MYLDFRTAMETYIEKAEQEINVLERELARIPKGRLQLDIRRYRRYMRVIEPDGTRYLVSTGDQHRMARVMEIQRRTLMERVLTRTRNNVKWAKLALDHYRETEPTKVMPTLSPAYRMVPENWAHSLQWLEYPDDAEWIEINNRRNPYHPENLIHMSSFGQLFRSKGELAIAELLHNEGLPFRYEPELLLDTEFGETVRYPDFEIRLGDGQSLYLEHLGLLSREEYTRTISEKLTLYYSNGICLGQNLLLTVDAPDGSINLSMIRAMVVAAKNLHPAVHRNSVAG